MMKKCDESVKINPYTNWHYILGHPYSILIIGVSGSGKTSALLGLKKTSTPRYWQTLYVKGLFELKYHLLIYGREEVGVRNLKKSQIQHYSQTIDDAYKTIIEMSIRL